jgi:hypothetical protein
MMATELQRTVSQFRFGARGAEAKRAEPRTPGRVVGRIAPGTSAARKPAPAEDLAA